MLFVEILKIIDTKNLKKTREIKICLDYCFLLLGYFYFVLYFFSLRVFFHLKQKIVEKLQLLLFFPCVPSFLLKNWNFSQN